MSPISAIAVAIVSAALGLACLLHPAAIQAHVIRVQFDRSVWGNSPFADWFTDWINQPRFCNFVRLMGVLVLLFAALGIIAAFTAH
jgi:hypothetical protein